MARIKRSKRKVSLAPIHLRMATELPINAEVAPAEVTNPLAAFGNTDTIRVMRNLRDDPLAGMHSRKQIDDAQFKAGRDWQRTCLNTLAITFGLAMPHPVATKYGAENHYAVGAGHHGSGHQGYYFRSGA
jgi:hypothetical protein